ncbi:MULTISPECIES: hypothetical protein [unclassified Variovorax]|uniref:hypothetical protein n=1 Tax=unclassified Variovorax TaxID=663243 RepID=UPI0025761644|nr:MULTISPECIES: hypothetical protein [unclassified Variovorax]MDM0086778.1 hypothetical protein [Variovorax sp. J22G40]MDM0144966.1 hypothetical protein [Variovorax sp. J2P1-31]
MNLIHTSGHVDALKSEHSDRRFWPVDQPTRLWIDTEFNGMGGELISIALVDEQGLTFYESLGCDNPVPWVAVNVMPIIGKPARPRATVQEKLSAWLARYPAIHIVADWPDDISHFCQLLITGPGVRLETPPLTLEIRRDLDGESKCPHNALADAIAIRAAHIHRDRTSP